MVFWQKKKKHFVIQTNTSPSYVWGQYGGNLEPLFFIHPDYDRYKGVLLSFPGPNCTGTKMCPSKGWKESPRWIWTRTFFIWQFFCKSDVPDSIAKLKLDFFLMWFVQVATLFGCASLWVGIVRVGREGAASFPIFPNINHTKCSFDRKYHAREG